MHNIVCIPLTKMKAHLWVIKGEDELGSQEKPFTSLTAQKLLKEKVCFLIQHQDSSYSDFPEISVASQSSTLIINQVQVIALSGLDW